MRLLKEPLLHFILIGTLLFGLYHLKNSRGTGGSSLRISADQVAEMATAFSNDWNREPTGTYSAFYLFYACAG